MLLGHHPDTWSSRAIGQFRVSRPGCQVRGKAQAAINREPLPELSLKAMEFSADKPRARRSQVCTAHAVVGRRSGDRRFYFASVSRDEEEAAGMRNGPAGSGGRRASGPDRRHAFGGSLKLVVGPNRSVVTCPFSVSPSSK